MQQLINKPTDPYSPLWATYWQQNPSLHRSVGAAGDNGEGDGEGGGDGGGSGDGDGAPDLAAMQKQWEEEKQKILGKNEELLGELKSIKQKAREAEEAARQAELEKAKKAGDHEQLYKSSEAEREKLARQLAELQQNIHQEKVSSAALKMAAEMADGPNAEILADYMAKRLKYTDDGLKVTDASGELTVSSLDDLKAEFKNSDRFQSLLRGNQASGGGAPGGKGGSASKSKKASDMTNTEKTEFISEYGLDAWQKKVTAESKS